MQARDVTFSVADPDQDIVGKRLTVKRQNNPGEKRNELIRFSAA